MKKVKLYFDEVSIIKTIPFKIGKKDGVLVHNLLSVGGVSDEHFDFECKQGLTREEEDLVLDEYYNCLSESKMK